MADISWSKRLQKHWLPDTYGNMKFWNDRFEMKKIDIDELNENLYRIFDNDITYLYRIFDNDYNYNGEN